MEAVGSFFKELLLSFTDHPPIIAMMDAILARVELINND